MYACMFPFDFSDRNSFRAQHIIPHPGMGRGAYHWIEHSSAFGIAKIWGNFIAFT